MFAYELLKTISFLTILVFDHVIPHILTTCLQQTWLQIVSGFSPKSNPSSNKQTKNPPVKIFNENSKGLKEITRKKITTKILSKIALEPMYSLSQLFLRDALSFLSIYLLCKIICSNVHTCTSTCPSICTHIENVKKYT